MNLDRLTFPIVQISLDLTSLDEALETAAIAVEAGVTPPERAVRIEGLLDRLGLGAQPLPYSLEAVLDHLATDKKHAGGQLRWVLPTADGVVVRDDIDGGLVERATLGLLAAGSPR